MKKQKKTGSVSRFCYQIIFRIVRKVYPGISVMGLENLPEEPCIAVGNHAQMNGPIALELYYPGPHVIWCAGEMMHLKEVPDYAFRDFWSEKPGCIRWLYRILSYLIAPLSVCVFNNANTVAVYHDSRAISAFKDTVKALQTGRSVVVFPECDLCYNEILNGFQNRFIDVAGLYHKRTGKSVAFLPMYLAPDLGTLYLGKPVTFSPDAPMELERQRICEYLMEEITAIARDLPRHRVVPYRNIPKKDYPFNMPQEVDKDHEEACC